MSRRKRILAAENLRWFDYALKGIDNGLIKEQRICYYTINASAGKEWQLRRTGLYLIKANRLLS